MLRALYFCCLLRRHRFTWARDLLCRLQVLESGTIFPHMAQVTFPLLCAACLFGLWSCGPKETPQPAAPSAIHHDFGTLPLGAVEDFTLQIPLPEGTGRIIPRLYNGDCTCASGHLMIRSADGKHSRSISGLRPEDSIMEADESLELRLRFDSSKKEVVDLPRTLSRGSLTYTELNQGHRRGRSIPVTFHYALKSPVKISPVAHIDFGELVQTNSYQQELHLQSNLPEVDIQFLRVNVSSDLLRASLDQKEGGASLKVTVNPDRKASLGKKIAEVTVQTDYEALSDVRILVSGVVRGEIWYQPSSFIHFNIFDFGQTKEDSVNITDHRLDRDPGFVVHSIVTEDGKDLRPYFQVNFAELANRKLRVTLKYLGNLEGNHLRGQLRLAKTLDQEPIAFINFSGHNKRRPQ